MASIVQYQTEDGRVPFEKWFTSLDARAALKVRTAIAQMEAGNFGDHKSVGSGVWERRIHFAKGYRIYYAKDGLNVILLLVGGTKSRQQSDIAQAKKYWLAHKRRKNQEKRDPQRLAETRTHTQKRRKS